MAKTLSFLTIQKDSSHLLTKLCKIDPERFYLGLLGRTHHKTISVSLSESVSISNKVKVNSEGTCVGQSVKHLPLVQVMIPGAWD